MRKLPIRFAFLLGFIGFVTSFGAHIVAVNLPYYIEQVGAGLVMIGLLIAIYDVAEIIAKPVFGALADRSGMKKTMQAGIIVFILASLLYLILPPKMLIVIRLLQGTGAAALSAVSLAMVGFYYKEKKGRAFGIYNAIKGIGYVLSPVVGGAIILKQSFSGIFLASAGVGVLALLVSFLLPKPEDHVENVFKADDDDLSFKAFFTVFRDAQLWPWYIVIVVNMFFMGVLFGFLPVYAKALHFSAMQNGILMSVVAIAYLGIQPLAGRLADGMNQVLLMRIGLAVSGVCTLLIPFSGIYTLPVAGVLAGMGIGTVWTNSDTLVSGLSQDGKLGATMGAAGSFKELGDMIGPLLMGLLSQWLGLTAGFIICGALGMIAIGLTWSEKGRG